MDIEVSVDIHRVIANKGHSTRILIPGRAGGSTTQVTTVGQHKAMGTTIGIGIKIYWFGTDQSSGVHGRILKGRGCFAQQVTDRIGEVRH